MKKLFLLISFLLFYNFHLYSQQIDSVESVNLLCKLIQIKSISGDEKFIFEYLVNWCNDKDLNTEILTNCDSSYNFITTLYPLSSNKPLVLFTAHLDVVPADTDMWIYPPFSGIIADSCIWGRGAIDDKGPLTMQLIALSSFTKSNKNIDLPYNIGVLAVSGEEVGGINGSFIVANNYLKKINPVVVFGEGGSGLQNVIPSYPEKIVFGISIAEKVPLWLKIEAKTRSKGHSASTNELYASKNLLKALMDIVDTPRPIKFDRITKKMLKELGRMEGGVKGFVIKNSGSWLFWPFVKSYFLEGGAFNSLVSDTYNITEINTIKSPTNAIPQQAYAYLDCRLLPGTSVKLFLMKLKLIAGNKVTISIVYQGTDAKPSSPDIYFDIMANSICKVFPNTEVQPILFPASTDNNTYRALGYNVFGITPMLMNNELVETVHNSNERMPIKELINGIKVYYNFIETIQKK